MKFLQQNLLQHLLLLQRLLPLLLLRQRRLRDQDGALDLRALRGRRFSGIDVGELLRRTARRAIRDGDGHLARPGGSALGSGQLFSRTERRAPHRARGAVLPIVEAGSVWRPAIASLRRYLDDYAHPVALFRFSERLHMTSKPDKCKPFSFPMVYDVVKTFSHGNRGIF